MDEQIPNTEMNEQDSNSKSVLKKDFRSLVSNITLVMIFIGIIIYVACLAHTKHEENKRIEQTSYDINKCSPLVRCVGDDIIMNKNEWDGNIFSVNSDKSHYLIDFGVARDSGTLRITVDKLSDIDNVSLKISSKYYPDSLEKDEIKRREQRDKRLHGDLYIPSTRDIGMAYANGYIDVEDGISLNKDEERYIIYLSSLMLERFDVRNNKIAEIQKRENFVKDSILSVKMKNVFFSNCK
jgi:hypothetical protein